MKGQSRPAVGQTHAPASSPQDFGGRQDVILEVLIQFRMQGKGQLLSRPTSDILSTHRCYIHAEYEQAFNMCVLHAKCEQAFGIVPGAKCEEAFSMLLGAKCEQAFSSMSMLLGAKCEQTFSMLLDVPVGIIQVD